MASQVGVSRTAQFWQITTPEGDHLLGGFPVSAVMSLIVGLTVPGIYVDLLDGTRLLAQPQNTKKNEPSHLILYRIRRNNIPALEQAGTISDLNILADQNVAEETHIVFLSNNVIAVLFNQDGPRISRLPEYLYRQFLIDIGVRPLLDPNTARNLQNMGQITSIELTIPVASAALLPTSDSNADETLNALKLMAEKSLGRTLHVKTVLSTRATSEGSQKWRALIDTVVLSPMLALFRKLKVHAKSNVPGGPSLTIDFAEEQLVLKVLVELTNESSRRAKPESVRQALVDAHTKLAGTIATSVPTVTTVMAMSDLLRPDS